MITDAIDSDSDRNEIENETGLKGIRKQDVLKHDYFGLKKGIEPYPFQNEFETLRHLESVIINNWQEVIGD